MTNLVKINPRANTAEQNGEGKGISRRNFLKIVGASTAVGVAGCADNAAQKILPNVRGEVEQIPGVAVWYNTTCMECTSGCGMQIRTREGRAVKAEGNPENPVSRGGLCALGQASLQHLYDPDRVRQPLKRVSGVGNSARFEPISWDEAYKTVADALKAALKPGQRRALITSEVSGAMRELRDEFAEKFSADVAVYDPLQPVALAEASELVFGTYGIPRYYFDKAEVIVNFGADAFETWVSPCEHARGWAKTRKSERPARVFHLEPRLSLTGASADSWLPINPGTEIYVAKALLQILLGKGRGQNLAPDVRKSLAGLVESVNLDDVAVRSGVPQEKILLMAHALESAKSSLIIAGGTAGSSSAALSLQVMVNFLNAVLENVNVTVDLNQMRRPETSVSKMKGLIGAMQEGKVAALFVHETNPAFTLPADYQFDYAARMVPLVVSFSSHLDETARLAHLVLPSNTFLESWGDARWFEGFNSIVQPTMTPVFDTRDFGDTLITLASRAGAPVTGTKIAGGQGGNFKTFKDFLQASWRSIHSRANSGEDFETFWKASLERGGFFQVREPSAMPVLDRVRVRVDRALFERQFNGPVFSDAYPKDRVEASKIPALEKGKGVEDLIFYPYPSVKTFDGRAANRPWLQEMGDPITQVAWDAWAEIHPDTAKALNVAQGDMLTVRNFFGELNVPVFITKYVKPQIVAVPLGQGHASYGRFAQAVGGGNAYSLLPADTGADSEGLSLLSAHARVKRGIGKSKLAVLQGGDSQHNRDIARTTLLKPAAGGNLVADRHDAKEHEHDIKQMYVQREHPVYEWGMTIDLSSCIGCSACVVACYAENNVPVVGKERAMEGREMSWLRIERYYDNATFDNKDELPQPEELYVSFLPMLCQHCHNAPCEPVCPVYATYHNEEGLNAMIYNRCVGTRYCSNNCPYKVRRFNWYDYELPEPLNWQLNPDVTKRSVGVMEKCTFCVQRIVEARDSAKDEGRLIRDGEVKPACVQSCPTQCITFGDLNDKNSLVSKQRKSKRAYKVLDYYINTQPAISYMERVRYEKS